MFAALQQMDDRRSVELGSTCGTEPRRLFLVQPDSTRTTASPTFQELASRGQFRTPLAPMSTAPRPRGRDTEWWQCVHSLRCVLVAEPRIGGYDQTGESYPEGEGGKPTADTTASERESGERVYRLYGLISATRGDILNTVRHEGCCQQPSSTLAVE
jgi:hypothetical protein